MSPQPRHPSPAHDHGPEDHEHADISLRGVVMTAVGLFIVGLVVQIAMAWMYMYFERRAERSPDPARALASATPRPAPQPALQANPAQDLKRLREQQRQRLYGYGWVDQANGIVHIPIDRAMKIMLERGYPVRPGASDDPGARALGSSSGRFAPRLEP